jgi:DNA-binding SARP family transcriptional activator
MIDVRTLGATELEENLGSKARPISVQAKRLALVAYLALAGGRYRRRDSIVALFWPDLDDEHARGALRQALSYLRRILGADVVMTRGEEEIALAPAALRCDAVLFDAAVATGRLDEAMALYRGDFLDGLFVSDASPELEQWIDEERGRLRRSAAWCCWSLASGSCDRGDRIGAATWGRRATALVPDDEGKLQWLIELFDSIGDRAGAVEAYERFARRLASEYSTEPSAETQALMNAVRSRSVASDLKPSIQPHRPRTSGAPRPTDEPSAPAAPPRGRSGRPFRTASTCSV